MALGATVAASATLVDGQVRPVRDNVRSYPAPSAAVGPRVKALREAMDLSLRDLAERSGVSAPMLSQVERGETSPTLQVAARIAAGLELRLSQLLRLDEERHRHRRARAASGRARRRRRPPLRGPHPAAARPARRGLAPHARARAPPPAAPATRRSTSPAPARPRSSQAGALDAASCDGAAHELARRRRVTFDADLPHHFENPGKEEAVLLAVVSAGLRRS